MRVLDDVLTKTGLSKKKRWIQKADSLFLIMQRGKGLPKRDGSYTGHITFENDVGDLSKVGQNHDPAERLLPSVKVNPFLSLQHTYNPHLSTHAWATCTRLKMNFMVKSLVKDTHLSKGVHVTTTVLLIISLSFFFSFFLPSFLPASLSS